MKQSRIVILVAAIACSAVFPFQASADVTGAQCVVDLKGICKTEPWYGSACDSDEVDKGKCSDILTETNKCCVPKSLMPQLLKADCGSLGGFCTKSSCSSVGSSFKGICSDVAGFNCCSLASVSSSSSSSSISAPGEYILLEKIPGGESAGSDLKSYVEAIYQSALVIVTLSAVLMLSIGGFMYLTSAGNTSAMGSAKSVIFDSLIGLVIAITAWLVLNVINPDLVNVTLNGLSSTPVAPSIPASAPPASGSGTPGTCGGYSVSGISSGQCADASQGLSDVLACMYGKYPGTKVTSISDSAGFSECKNSWTDPKCAHAETSCHYGGGSSKTSAECQKSQAADFSIKNASGVVDLSIAKAVMSAASACGGRVHDESSAAHPHIHVSAQTSCCSK